MDVNIIRIVLLTLGIVCVLCIGGSVFLTSIGITPPHALYDLATISIGALVGILATPRFPPSSGANAKDQ